MSGCTLTSVTSTMLRLAGFARFLGRSSCTRPIQSYRPRPLSSLSSNLTFDTAPSSTSSTPNPNSVPYPDYGTYSIILPPEPFQFGTSHIPVLPVPPSITRPQYVNEGR